MKNIYEWNLILKKKYYSRYVNEIFYLILFFLMSRDN